MYLADFDPNPHPLAAVLAGCLQSPQHTPTQVREPPGGYCVGVSSQPDLHFAALRRRLYGEVEHAPIGRAAMVDMEAKPPVGLLSDRPPLHSPRLRRLRQKPASLALGH